MQQRHQCMDSGQGRRRTISLFCRQQSLSVMFRNDVQRFGIALGLAYTLPLFCAPIDIFHRPDINE